MKQDNQKYCLECSEIINIKAEICPKCGVRQASSLQPPDNNNSHIQSVNNERWLTTLLLCWFLGIFGIHRFYTGHTAVGVIQLLTGGGCGIWTLIDFIIIITGGYKDADGNSIKSN